MLTKLLKLTTLTLCLFFIADFSYGQNFNDALRLSEPGLGFSARALGMGNSFNAISDDYSAVYFNPAGLGLLKRMELAGGLNFSDFNANTTFFGDKTDYANSATKLDQFSFAFPFPTIRGSLVFAVGYSRNKDFNNTLSFSGFNPGNSSMIQDLASVNDDIAFKLGLSYPVYNSAGDYVKDATIINGKLFQSGTNISNGNIGKWSFAGAVEILQNVFIGGTFNVVSGSFERTRNYTEEDINGVYSGRLLDPNDENTRDFQSFNFDETLNWDISGWDAKLGLLFQPSDITRVGFSIQFPTAYKIKETYSVDANSYFGTGVSFNDNTGESTSEYYINSPYIMTGGASVNLRGLILSGELSYIDYTQMQFDTDHGDLSTTTILDNNKEIKQLFRGVVNYNVGAEYRIPRSDFRIRGGFIYNPSAFKNDPTTYDKKYITGGVGYLIDQSLSIDLGYAYGWWKDIQDNYGYNVSRTNQDIKFHNLLMSLAYRF